jgi:transposase
LRGRPFVIDWDPADTPEALKAAYQAEREPRRRSQLHGVWLLRRGWRLEAVAEAVGVHYRTVQRWAAWYRDGGRAEFGRHRLGGRGATPFLTPERQAEVAEEVATGRFRTAAAIREWIAATYGVAYTEGGGYSLLARLGCAPKVPRPQHAKADEAAQAAWKKGASSRHSARRA